MRTPSIAAFAALASLSLATSALADPAKPQPSDTQCFARQEIQGFSAPNDHTVYLRVGVSDIYRLDLMSDCPDLSFRFGVGLKTTPASPWICSPLDADVVYHQDGIPVRCPVTAYHKLTPAEVASLPKRDVP